MKVHIVPHNPTWSTKFQSAKASLESILSEAAYMSIEHVGSTSIPGLEAKPVLDIDIIVTPEMLPAVRQALVQAGYFDCGEMNVPGRFQFRQPGFGQYDAAWGDHGMASDEMRMNTYAMIDGCLALRNHLDVRKTLLHDESLREEYGAVKKELSARDFQNMGEYAAAKNDILWKILTKAGWSEEDLDVVRKANTPVRPS
ncbi:hypothetical protein BP6252_03377 [Coleophoma cylindrospora]|uniref:GrpB family protein n=1 Tax=Coleophoma cylindrospora TaxID=1849047 RepID=A0A3D8S7I3_9HELO|nr:hypothetical protein BP6252_03377 [Coleophoma cylindrospora]